MWYNAQSGVTQYHLPVLATSVTKVVVDGVVTTAYTYYPATGIVEFNTAPPVTNPPTNNTVQITYTLANPTAKAILKYEKGYGKIGQDFNLELGRIHSAVKSEFYKDMDLKGFKGLKISAIRNAASGKSVGMDADWGIDETGKITGLF